MKKTGILILSLLILSAFVAGVSAKEKVLDIIHLNKKKLAFNNKSKVSIIKPNFKKNIPNMGMKRDGKIGNLVVVFDIMFPDTLSEEHTETLATIL